MFGRKKTAKRNKKILVIEDDSLLANILIDSITRGGYEAINVLDGLQALDTAKKIKPDLILLDVLLSGLDGRDIAYKIKNTVETKDIPIIMLSASPQTDRSSRDFGADDFIAKPFELKELFEILKKYL